jgi:hypothetical protein
MDRISSIFVLLIGLLFLGIAVVWMDMRNSDDEEEDASLEVKPLKTQKPIEVVSGESSDSKSSPLTRLQHHMKQFVNALYRKHASDPRVRRLYHRFNPHNIQESPDRETYTLNKETVMVCLHDNFNLLVFVTLHELGHLMSVSLHHTPEFWTNFRFLLREAIGMNMYVPVDYSQDKQQYCKMVVTDNPIFEPNVSQDQASELLTTMSHAMKNT